MIVWLLIWIVWFLVANRESNAQKTEYKSVDGIGHETLEEAGGKELVERRCEHKPRRKSLKQCFFTKGEHIA